MIIVIIFLVAGWQRSSVYAVYSVVITLQCSCLYSLCCCLTINGNISHLFLHTTNLRHPNIKQNVCKTRIWYGLRQAASRCSKVARFSSLHAVTASIFRSNKILKCSATLWIRAFKSCRDDISLLQWLWCVHNAIRWPHSIHSLQCSMSNLSYSMVSSSSACCR